MWLRPKKVSGYEPTEAGGEAMEGELLYIRGMAIETLVGKMNVSWNRGTPKTFLLMAFSIINYPAKWEVNL